MKRENALAMKAAATYIGTVIGAGFATGQEMLQFFVRFGVMGFVGLAFAAAMFIFFGFIIMDLGRRLNARSYREIIHFFGREGAGRRHRWDHHLLFVRVPDGDDRRDRRAV